MKLKKLTKLFFLLSLITILGLNFNLIAYASIKTNSNDIAQEKNYASHEILVKFRSCVNETEKESIRQGLKAIKIKFIKSIQVEYWKLPKNIMIDEALKILKGIPIIEHVEPNFLFKPNALPNDPHFDKLWYLKNTGQSINGSKGKIGADISISQAWEIETGNHNIIIAVIDTGVAYDHPDLKNNIWTNRKEIPENEIDDDKNGFIDDVHGWDFVYDDNDPSDYSYSLSEGGHGTHIAGLIAAQGNNAIGVSGVMWKAQIMALKIYDLSETGSYNELLIKEINIISSIEYAVNNGARIINCSFGGDYILSKFIYDIIEYANHNGVLIVASVGNETNNNDIDPRYPSNYDLPNIVSVAATNHKDELASYSNFGPQTVDIAAPGGEIPSIYSAIPPQRVVLFFDDFESGKGKWLTSGNYEEWSIGTNSQDDSSECIIDSISDYKENEESYIKTSAPISIKNCKGLYLEFNINYEIEYGYDHLFLDVSFEGQNFFNLCNFTGSGSMKYNIWTDDWNKENLYLRFLLSTDSAINNDGVYIDDIKLTGIPWEFTGDEYGYKMGTSMAAPIVSGIAGLIWSYKPNLNHLEVKNAILNSVDKLSSLRGKVLTEGRVNAYKALLYTQAQETYEDEEEGSGCFINSVSLGRLRSRQDPEARRNQNF